MEGSFSLQKWNTGRWPEQRRVAVWLEQSHVPDNIPQREGPLNCGKRKWSLNKDQERVLAGEDRGGEMPSAFLV